MLGVGFSAARTTSGLPLVMPPLMPPSWFVALRTPAPGRGESAADLHPLDRRDGEEQVGDEALGRVEEGLAQADRHPFGAALDDAADRVVCGRRSCEHLVEALRGGASADLGQAGPEAQLRREHLLGHDPRGDERHGQTSREVSAAARVVPSARPEVGDAVGV